MRAKLIEVRSLVRRALCEEQAVDKPADLSQFYPTGHQLGMRVPKGGSSCSKCRWVSDDRKSCGNQYFQKWRAEMKGAEDPSKLPAPADEYCCDDYER